MNLYKIRDWDKLFETGETRKLLNLRWVPIPNKHDGKSYRRISMMKNACEVFTAWMLILQIASKCVPRGSLIDGNIPLTTEDMSIMTGFSEHIFKNSLAILSNGHIDWIECVVFGSNTESPVIAGEHPETTGTSPAEGREGTEGIEEKEALITKDSNAIEVLRYLNMKTQKTFQNVEANIKMINARIKDGATLDDLKRVIDVKCSQWLKDPKWSQYLRPATLFNAEKFANYSGETGASLSSKAPPSGSEILNSYQK